jgi:hypothetical protein
MSETVVLKSDVKQFKHFLGPDIGLVTSPEEPLIPPASWAEEICRTLLPAIHCTCGRFRFTMADDEAANIDE